MARIRISGTNFYEDELIPKVVYNNRRLRNEWFIPKKTMKVQQDIRKLYGPLYLNTWWNGGRFHHRGYRQPDCPDGSQYSRHKFADAGDNVPIDCQAFEIIDDIIMFNKAIRAGNPNKIKIPWFAYQITCVEYSIKGVRPGWAHWDLRPTREKHGLLILKL